ncbi:Uncharacterised protein [Legionella steigerwaltii]|uniref:Uncharacterized protein n=1 Tax=Legionella steigerwaltii TaxID=460 RepID=A0A378LDK6_9GAMM|nr:hypothetical protein [Legionella steigerwaltii]KTD71681.1 hypothetical protein Lstg_2889 [Legionella steigerwaltii]STY23849.1 Uncharacterised protein [Legionella steigerwaltii]
MPYTTKLLNAQNEELAFQTVVKPSPRGKKYLAFEVYIGEGKNRKLVGAMDYNVRPHCIHINRMDNFQNGFPPQNPQFIKHMGYLFLEHALRESFARGFQGKLELEAIEYSPIAYFKFGMRKDSRMACEMSDLFLAINMIENFNESMPMDQRKQFRSELLDSLCFGNFLFNSEDLETKKALEMAVDKMLAGETKGQILEAKEDLLQLIEKRMKLIKESTWGIPYQLLLSTAASQLGIPKDQSDTLTFKQIIEYGCQDVDNLEFSNWVTNPETAKLPPEEFAKAYLSQMLKCRMQSSMHLPEAARQKKMLELQIDPQKPFHGIEHHEDKRIPLVDKMIGKLSKVPSSSHLNYLLGELKENLLKGNEDSKSLLHDIESIKTKIEQKKKLAPKVDKKEESESGPFSFWSKPTDVYDELMDLIGQLEQIAKNSSNLTLQ